MICKGLLSIEWDLKWCESVHGKIYNILIENEEYILHFPLLPKNWKAKDTNMDHLNSPLTEQKILKGWKRKNGPIDFGYPMSYPQLDSIVNAVEISFECEENNIEYKKNVLYRQKHQLGAFFLPRFLY